MVLENTLAPDFILPDKAGTPHALHDYRGKWILVYFYPKDDTPGCTKEACVLRDNFPAFKDSELEIVGISKDAPESHAQFAEKYSLPFLLLSDAEQAVIHAYGADEEGRKRISYLIDPEGIVRKAYAKVTPETHAEEVLKDFEVLKSEK
jgi:peroxiredoxin Q/BCP